DAPVANLANVVIKTVAVGTRTKFTRFDVTGLPLGATIELRCTGKGCPFTRPRLIPTRSGKDSHLANGFRKERYAAGTVLQVTVSGPYTTPKVFRFTMRAHRTPKRS